MKFTLLSGLLPVFALALPSFGTDGLHYHSLKARAQNLPTLKLPYGTWQATKYDSANDVRKQFVIGSPDIDMMNSSTSSGISASQQHQLGLSDSLNPLHQYLQTISKQEPRVEHVLKVLLRVYSVVPWDLGWVLWLLGSLVIWTWAKQWEEVPRLKTVCFSIFTCLRRP